ELAAAHAADVGLEVLVAGDREAAAEVQGGAQFAEAVVAAEGGAALALQDAPQQGLLHRARAVGGRLEGVELTADRQGHDLADDLAQQPGEHGASATGP